MSEATPESRAIARALASRWRDTRTQDDWDDMTIFHYGLVCGGGDPDYSVIERLPAYQRGRDLVEKSGMGEKARANVDAMTDEQREQLCSDTVLRLEFAQSFIDAWGRRVQGLPCPIRIEGGEIQNRHLVSRLRWSPMRFALPPNPVVYQDMARRLWPGWEPPSPPVVHQDEQGEYIWVGKTLPMNVRRGEPNWVRDQVQPAGAQPKEQSNGER